MKFVKRISAAILFLNLPVSCAGSPDSAYSFESRQMAVDFRIVLYAASFEQAESAANKAFQRISQLNDIMSDYKTDSEIWKLSENSGKNENTLVSTDLWNVMEAAREINSLSNAAFDVTAGPLTLLWRQSRWTKKIPRQRSLERAMLRVGMDKVIFDEQNRRLLLTTGGMRLDLGGIAKGYAADEALKSLCHDGIKHALVDGSGDMVMTTHPQGQWPLYISDTKDEKGDLIHLKRGAIATSGDTLQYVEINGKRYSHIIDPRSGFALENRCRVSVIANNCRQADSLASAISVMGPQEGLRMIEKTSGAEALIVQVRDGCKFYYKSSAFPEFEKLK
ncbi:MAG: FAD:protein FMN transferase [Akkermansiaceae bacterium]|nr:FAD:protein FMN transferase [Akkermansiaceae bacterium]